MINFIFIMKAFRMNTHFSVTNNRIGSLKSWLLAVACWFFAAGNAVAGGMLTNTNQNVAFLRNPARDAAIGIDGVYSNPAGVAFLRDGWHLSFNWQNAHQTRTVVSTNPLYQLGVKNNGQDTKTFEGVADAPVIPSVQAAYNQGKWSLQAGFAVAGGGGKCEYSQGVGSFEQAVGTVAQRLNPLGALGYDVDGFMSGRQYYFGFSLGAAYQLNDHLSVYGGLRLLYGSATYKAKMSNIQVKTADGMVPFGTFLDAAAGKVAGGIAQYTDAIGQLQNGIAQLENGIAQYNAANIPVPETLTEQLATLNETLAKAEAGKTTLEGTQESLNQLELYRDGVNLMSDQSGWGVAPIIGIDYKTGVFNFSAKYEFKTRMRMENNSTAKSASIVEAVNKYLDGTSVPEDAPALLTLGAQWSVTDVVRLSAGYHYFFDKSAHWYNHDERKLDGGTNEFLGGAEWDITKHLQMSGGVQLTRYGLTDDYMNDMSFVVNSWSFGVGLGYRVNDHLKVNLAYFQTNYDDYDRVKSESPRVSDSFTRTNRVLGLGVDVDF